MGFVNYKMDGRIILGKAYLCTHLYVLDLFEKKQELLEINDIKFLVGFIVVNKFLVGFIVVKLNQVNCIAILCY